MRDKGIYRVFETLRAGYRAPGMARKGVRRRQYCAAVLFHDGAGKRCSRRHIIYLIAKDVWQDVFLLSPLRTFKR
jgi:hypothetical protein